MGVGDIFAKTFVIQEGCIGILSLIRVVIHRVFTTRSTATELLPLTVGIVSRIWILQRLYTSFFSGLGLDCAYLERVFLSELRALDILESAMSITDSFDIGYALAQKKQRSFVQPTLVSHAKSKGINLLSIDPHRPLVEQGPFDAILHKVSGEDWVRQLAEYEHRYPDVIIVDRPEAIQRLHNRISMLQAVSELEVNEERATFGIPKQCVAENGDELNNLRSMVGLKFPVIAKPLVADGSAKSHAMSLIFNAEGLTRLKPPVVIQEFVNHGGVIFKVYVVGDYVKCVRRKSLPDVDDNEMKSTEAPLSFSQISNMGSAPEQSSEAVDEKLSTAELPPAKFLADIAKGLRLALGLRLFNFDVIRDVRLGNHYHVIDINYFPGYAKMPVYESVLTEFFLGLAREKAAAGDPVHMEAVTN